MKRENPSIEICPGITRRTVANGKTMYQMIATLAAGSRMPEHRHAQEHIVYILVRCRSYQQRRPRCDNQTPMNTGVVRPPDPYPDCKHATLQTSSKNDSRV
jgi:hypothetical protein